MIKNPFLRILLGIAFLLIAWEALPFVISKLEPSSPIPALLSDIEGEIKARDNSVNARVDFFDTPPWSIAKYRVLSRKLRFDQEQAYTLLASPKVSTLQKQLLIATFYDDSLKEQIELARRTLEFRERQEIDDALLADAVWHPGGEDSNKLLVNFDDPVVIKVLSEFLKSRAVDGKSKTAIHSILAGKAKPAGSCIFLGHVCVGW